ncbi:MAG TPA: hypothetical protein VGQ41_13730 [Pyrinomonadaceae bacterium]|jgi:hypothetical protein|nr:hypothetical protein [Pyrinomonadaceae bacterium]
MLVTENTFNKDGRLITPDYVLSKAAALGNHGEHNRCYQDASPSIPSFGSDVPHLLKTNVLRPARHSPSARVSSPEG